MDEYKTSYIDIGKLAEPASKLVEKVSGFIEGVLLPTQMRRLAYAEVDVEVIKTEGQLKISEAQQRTQRAMSRFIHEEERKQLNMENITAKALPEVKEDAKPENIDNDWLMNFYDKCRLTSDEEMQDLWAKILAGEANSNGGFSKKTVNLVASLDKSDAEIFMKLISFNFGFGKKRPLIYESGDSIYADNGLTFNSIMDLDSLGLLSFDFLSAYTIQLANPILFKEDSLNLVVRFANDDYNAFRIGSVMLSKSGLELASICNVERCNGFKEYVLEKWKSFGYKITEMNQSEIDEIKKLPNQIT
jgi:Protein of unknown function (DUF2806)